MTTPKTTRALALREGGYAAGPAPQVPESLTPFLELREVSLPAPRPGQVVVEVALSPVNPSDLFFVQGAYGQPRVAGQAAGFEGTGRVIAGNGAEAEALIGRRVAFLGTGTGTWAQHALADAALCIPLAEGLREADGAALIVNPLTAVALVEIVRATGTRSFLLNAAGSQLGRLILGLARDEGLEAIAVVRRAEAAEELRAAGAAEVLVTGTDSFARDAAMAIKALKPRVLLDALGDQTTADLFFAMPTGARWVSYGKMSDEAPRLTQLGQLIFMAKQIEGFWLSRWLPAAPPGRRAAVIAQVQERFLGGAWSTRVAAELPLETAIDGILPALASGSGKVMVRP